MSLVPSHADTNVPLERAASLQTVIGPAVHGLPSSVPAQGSVTSNPIRSFGWQKGGVGLESTQSGTLTVQRYLDQGGTIPVGNAIETALSANTATSVSWRDGLPYGSFIITVTNSAGAPADLSNVVAALQAQ